MMERNGNAIRSIAWMEIFPWLNIFKTFRLAIGFRALVMSALAILLTATGWAIFGHIFSTDNATAWLEPYAACPWTKLTDMVPDHPVFLGGLPGAVENTEMPAKIVSEKDIRAVTARMAHQNKSPSFYEPLTGSWWLLNQPLWNGFGLDVTFGNTICLICCGLWALATWAFFGAAVTRIAAVQLAANERITWGAALRHACSKFFAYFFAPLFRS